MKNISFRARMVIYLHTLECMRGTDIDTGMATPICTCDFELHKGEEALVLDTANVTSLFGGLHMDTHIAFVPKYGLLAFYMNRMDRHLYMEPCEAA